ncbi:hypothetical protein GCM10023163_17130 [Aestuariibaculum suncheonense]
MKEFKHYPNTEKVTSSRSIFKHYFIENAPKNNLKLRKLTDKYSDSIMTYKLSDSLKSIIIMYYTDKNKFWLVNVNENYYGEGYGPEDYYNPRRAEYDYRLSTKGEIWLERIIYENETKKVIPKISFIENKKLEKKHE